METNKTVKRYKIPHDVMMDILRILLKNRIPHTIEGIEEKLDIIRMQASFNEDKEKHQQARENIESILNDYSHHMEGILSDILIEEENE